MILTCFGNWVNCCYYNKCTGYTNRNFYYTNLLQQLSDAAMDLGTPSAPPIIDIGREELNTETTDENQPGMSSGGRFDLKKNNEEEENMFKVESAPHEFCKRYTFVVVYVILLVQDLFSLMPWLSMEILL